MKKANHLQRLLTAALIFIASIATSTHVTIVIFVVAFGFVMFRQMMYVSHLETARSVGREYLDARLAQMQETEREPVRLPEREVAVVPGESDADRHHYSDRQGYDDEPDLDEVPAEVRDEITIHLVSDVADVLRLALEPAAESLEELMAVA